MAKGDIDWCRIIMDKETRNIISKLCYNEMDAFEISGRNWKKFPFKTYQSSVFPEFDLMEEPTVENKYDIVLAEQVLEHVRNPYRALQSVHKILKPGGYFLNTTPFLLKVHGSPKGRPIDYWRFTPEGIKLLFEDSNFNVMEQGAWGNEACIVEYLNFQSRAPYSSERCSLINEPDKPIMVWILGQKNV